MPRNDDDGERQSSSSPPTTALPTLTAPLATVVTAPTATEPAATPTLTAVPATDAAVVATEMTAQPLIDIKAAVQALPRAIFFERMKAESGGVIAE